MWAFDYTSSLTSYPNLVERLDLQCANKLTLSMLGSLIFIGQSIAAVTITRVADLYGRRRVFLTGLFSLITISLTICFSTNLVLTYVAMFAYGFCCPIAIYTVGYPYVLEFYETD
mmetsp:Transcript_6567/g.4720  ORF Transcript_6567/g.4720 Transcript_6567/m.4720 type:complete len:115 (-) Transcript_6567:975-1319(-)